jgi:hypothetical protein
MESIQLVKLSHIQITPIIRRAKDKMDLIEGYKVHGALTGHNMLNVSGEFPFHLILPIYRQGTHEHRPNASQGNLYILDALGENAIPNVNPRTNSTALFTVHVPPTDEKLVLQPDLVSVPFSLNVLSENIPAISLTIRDYFNGDKVCLQAGPGMQVRGKIEVPPYWAQKRAFLCIQRKFNAPTLKSTELRAVKLFPNAHEWIQDVITYGNIQFNCKSPM